MLRAVSTIYIESQTLERELFARARRDVFKVFRTDTYSTSTHPSQTVLTSGEVKAESATARAVEATSVSSSQSPSPCSPPTASPPPLPPPAPPQPPAPPTRRAWTLAAAALAITASLGGVYFYRKMNDRDKKEGTQLNSAGVVPTAGVEEADVAGSAGGAPVPASGASLPRHVQYLLVGGGTASFAALRAIRSARPDAQVLVVGEELALPYMRPPLSKELWREPDLARRAAAPDSLTFRQWNGKRRSVVYEPSAFYTPVERLRDGVAGAGVARGWRVTRVDVEKHEAELVAPGHPPVTLGYDKCLLATGVRAARVAPLAGARAAGRSLALRGLRDAARLAAALDEPAVRRVAVVGGGFLASELSAALAARLHESGKTVMQVFRESAAMAAVLPHYLAADASRRIAEAGVELLPDAEVTEATVSGGRVQLRLSSGASVEADLVVECTGSEPAVEAARASGLELHPQLGGVLVNAELQARADVYAAGDVACFYDVALGRRRVEHHDHAVVSGRLAGENMAALAPPKHYTHQSMFWSDLGPQLGYEAIGIIDSRLPTVGVFSADAVSETEASAGAIAAAGAGAGTASADAGEGAAGADADAGEGAAGADAGEGAAARRYERGVVFYLRDKRVVGVLLWNLFNRMHVARQVLAQGEFEDLFEVAKLFSPQEED